MEYGVTRNPPRFLAEKSVREDGPTIEFARDAARDLCGVGGVSRQGNRNGLSLARDWGSDRLGMQKGRWSSTAAMAHYLHDDDEAKQDAQMKRIKRRAKPAKQATVK